MILYRLSVVVNGQVVAPPEDLQAAVGTISGRSWWRVQQAVCSSFSPHKPWRHPRLCLRWLSLLHPRCLIYVHMWCSAGWSQAECYLRGRRLYLN